MNTNTEAGLKLLLSNTMSLSPKIDDIRCCILELKPDVAIRQSKTDQLKDGGT